MKAIWKYPLAVTDEQTVNMKQGAEILCVQVQDGVPCLWAVIDDVLPGRLRSFRLYGTGHPVDDLGRYVGTFQLHGGSLVFHLFEVPTT